MFTSIIRAAILYALILFVIRLMGKRQLGEMQPFELVITLIIADLACIPMADVGIPILHGVTPLLTLVLLHFLVSLLSRKSIMLRKLFNGKPIIVIDPDGIRYDALKSLNMTVNDLCEGIRACEYFSFDEIAYAIVETNGTLSVLAKSAKKPATAEDAKIKTDEASLNVILINDGKVIAENLKYMGLSEDIIKTKLSENNIKSPKDVLIFSVDKSGQVYFQPKGGSCKTLQIDPKQFKGGA